jgi:peptide/nickel transport system permease protein
VGSAGSGLDSIAGGLRLRPVQLMVLRHAVRFAGVVVVSWVVLFVLLHLLTGSAGDPIALQLPLDRLSVTLPLVVMAGVLALLIGGAIGLLASRLGRPGDRWLTGQATLLGFLPAFWIGLLLALSLNGTLPTSGFIPWSDGPAGALSSLVVPALALGLSHAGQFALHLREAFGGEPGQPAVLKLRIAGLTDRRARWLLGYAQMLKRGPELVGRLFVSVLVGTIVVENVFYLPGIGRQVLGAAMGHDLDGVRAGLFIVLVLAALIMLIARILPVGMSALRRRPQ